MALHRCVVADFLSNTTLTEMDLAVDTCQRRIIVPGQFSATAPLTNRDEAAKARKIVVNRTKIHMWKDNIPWGTYFIRYAQPEEDEEGNLTLRITGQSLEVYPYLRKIRTTLNYAGMDQLDIARALLNNMASRPESDIGLNLMAGLSGVTRDRTYKAGENASYGTRLEQLANVINGFEYMVRTVLDPDTDQLRYDWVWGYPTLGSPEVVRDITQPGHIKSWAMPQDGTEAGNAWQTMGDTLNDDLGTPSEPVMSLVYEDAARLAAGEPLLDRTETYSSVKLQSTLNAYAQQLRDTRSGPVTVPQIRVRFDDSFSIDPNYLGDRARFTLLNDYYPLDDTGAPTFSRDWRIVGMDLKTPKGEDQEASAELLFEGAT
ncbi:hypothetical protein [Streptosporangium canum]|uniref:hypothetical protein n=1 Tax=Streptosporangium canum TaxID=324952 RepID=UPI000B823220|nr:hypothetical protein [Streptosporangium canum]